MRRPVLAFVLVALLTTPAYASAGGPLGDVERLAVIVPEFTAVGKSDLVSVTLDGPAFAGREIVLYRGTTQVGSAIATSARTLSFVVTFPTAGVTEMHAKARVAPLVNSAADTTSDKVTTTTRSGPETPIAVETTPIPGAFLQRVTWSMPAPGPYEEPVSRFEVQRRDGANWVHVGDASTASFDLPHPVGAPHAVRVIAHGPRVSSAPSAVAVMLDPGAFPAPVLLVDATGAAPRLTWDVPSPAPQGFVLHRRSGARAATEVAVLPGDARAHEDHFADAGASAWWIVAWSGTRSASSAEATADLAAQPMTITAVADDDARVQVSWPGSLLSSEVTAIRLERTTPGLGTFTGAFPTTAREFTDVQEVTDTTVHYTLTITRPTGDLVATTSVFVPDSGHANVFTKLDHIRVCWNSGCANVQPGGAADIPAGSTVTITNVVSGKLTQWGQPAADEPVRVSTSATLRTGSGGLVGTAILPPTTLVTDATGAFSGSSQSYPSTNFCCTFLYRYTTTTRVMGPATAFETTSLIFLRIH